MGNESLGGNSSRFWEKIETTSALTKKIQPFFQTEKPVFFNRTILNVR